MSERPHLPWASRSATVPPCVLGPTRVPPLPSAGDLKFDPLRITRSLGYDEKVQFLEKELLNGRLAMIAVTCYVIEEAVFQVTLTRAPVAMATPPPPPPPAPSLQITTPSHPGPTTTAPSSHRVSNPPDRCRWCATPRTFSSRSSSPTTSARSWTRLSSQPPWKALSTASPTKEDSTMCTTRRAAQGTPRVLPVGIVALLSSIEPAAPQKGAVVIGACALGTALHGVYRYTSLAPANPGIRLSVSCLCVLAVL